MQAYIIIDQTFCTRFTIQVKRVTLYQLQSLLENLAHCRLITIEVACYVDRWVNRMVNDAHASSHAPSNRIVNHPHTSFHAPYYRIVSDLHASFHAPPQRMVNDPHASFHASSIWSSKLLTWNLLWFLPSSRFSLQLLPAPFLWLSVSQEVGTASNNGVPLQSNLLRLKTVLWMKVLRIMHAFTCFIFHQLRSLSAVALSPRLSRAWTCKRVSRTYHLPTQMHL